MILVPLIALYQQLPYAYVFVCICIPHILLAVSKKGRVLLGALEGGCTLLKSSVKGK